MKKLLFIIMMLCGLVACGGDDSSANADDQTLTKEQIEEKFNLPPEITIDEANKTVLGPLGDDNIRLDLKRKIVFAAPTDSPEDIKTRKVYLRLAQIWTEMIQNQDDRDKLLELDYERSVIWACVINNYTKKTDSLKTFRFDLRYNGADERAEIYDKINEQLDVDFGIIPASVYEAKCDSL